MVQYTRTTHSHNFSFQYFCFVLNILIVLDIYVYYISVYMCVFEWISVSQMMHVCTHTHWNHHFTISLYLYRTGRILIRHLCDLIFVILYHLSSMPFVRCVFVCYICCQVEINKCACIVYRRSSKSLGRINNWIQPLIKSKGIVNTCEYVMVAKI